MIRKIRKIFAASLLGVALCSQGVGADFLDNCLCGTVGVWGQATYFKPTNGAETYAWQWPARMLSTFGLLLDGPIKSRNVCPKYEWGFEAGATYLTRGECFYAKIFGGWTEFTDHSRAAGFLSPQLPIRPVVAQLSVQIIGTAKGDLLSEYWYVDARLGHYLMRGCGSNVHAFLGVRYVNLLDRLAVRFDGTDDFPAVTTIVTQRQRAELSVTGPELGMGGQFCVWGDFGISGELGVMALIGSRKTRGRAFQFLATTPQRSGFNEFQYNNCVVVVPGIDIQAGANWSMEWCKFKGNVEIGYKLHHYFDAFEQAVFSPPLQDLGGLTAAGVPTTIRDAGFAGPYISVGVAY